MENNKNDIVDYFIILLVAGLIVLAFYKMSSIESKVDNINKYFKEAKVKRTTKPKRRIKTI